MVSKLRAAFPKLYPSAKGSGSSKGGAVKKEKGAKDANSGQKAHSASAAAVARSKTPPRSPRSKTETTTAAAATSTTERARKASVSVPMPGADEEGMVKALVKEGWVRAAAKYGASVQCLASHPPYLRLVSTPFGSSLV